MISWGITLERGEKRQIAINEEEVLHISQATLAVEKHHLGEPTSVRIEVGGELFALIALNPERFPQQLCDLVLERTFTVSNNWENGSVVLSGYKTDQPAGKDEFLHGDVDDEKDEAVLAASKLGKLVEKKLDARQVKEAKEEEVSKKDSDNEEGSKSTADVMGSTCKSCKRPL